jgi:hypothetical protein
MSRKRKAVAAVAAGALLIAVVAGAAIGGSGPAGIGGGPAANLDFVTGGRVDTPSASFQPVIAKSFEAQRGVLVVRFSAEGCVQDTNAQAQFVGRAYAAIKVRVLLNGVPLAPGAVTLMDNAGKIGERCGLEGTRASAASFEWGGLVTTAGQQTVEVQFRNIRVFDSATLLRSTLAIHHG